GHRFQELLAIGGRMFHETHMAPLLRLQGAVREIALEVVRVDGSVLPCLLNAVEIRDDDGAPLLVRATLFEATARRRYERELLAAQRTAEESEARSRTLQAVVSDLAAAISVADVATVIVEHSRRAAQARGTALLLVEEPEADEPRLRLARAEGLPDSLLHELRLAAGGRLALERAQLHEETARQAERAAFLLDAARLMAAAADVGEVVDRLADLAVARLADLCVIDLVGDQGVLRAAVRHADPLRQDLVDE